MTDKAVAKATAGIPALLTDAVEQFRRALPAHMSAERFTRVALTVFRTNPQLQTCNPQSFLGAMMQAAQLGLEPGMGDQVYLIPYGKEVTLQYGYRGLLELARRSGEIQFVTVQEVRTVDEFSYAFGSDQHLRHKPAAGERGEPTHYYAFLKYKDGGEHFEVMSVSDILRHKKRWVKQEGPAWKSAPDAMAKKTVLRAALKYAPSSVEKSSQTAIGSESRSIRVIDGDLQVGQVFDEPDEKANSIAELDGGQDVKK